MKLVIAGKSFIACQALRHVHDLLQLGWIQAEFIAMPNSNDDRQETWQPSLRRTADTLGIPIGADWKALDLTAGDVVISLEYDRLIRENALNGARAYNIHFSNLPLYRGCLTSIWPLREGQTTAGVTLHVITPGVDDGPIIDQRLFEVPEFFSAYDLYTFYNAYAFELLKANLPALLTGNVQPIEQEHDRATLYKRNSVDFTQIEIRDFNCPAAQVVNQVRALIFQPYQLPLFRGKPVAAVDDLKFTPPMASSPGEILRETDTHVIVACQEGCVRLEYANAPQFRLFMVRSAC